MSINSLYDLLGNHLRKLYFSEKALVRALPYMRAVLADPLLRDSVARQRRQCRHQIRRLRSLVDQTQTGCTENCANHARAIESLVEEAMDYAENSLTPEVRDAGLLAVMQRIVYQRISLYASAIGFATEIGDFAMVDLLEISLEELKESGNELKRFALNGVREEGIGVSA